MKFRAYIYDWIACIFFIALPLIVFQQIAGSLTQQGAISGGPLQNAAIFPQVLAWCMIILCAINAFQIVRNIIPESAMTTTATTRLALKCTVLFVLYLLVIKFAGFYLATPVLLGALFIAFGLAFHWSILGSLLATVTIAAVFEGGLNVVLPLGWLRFTLFG